MHNKIHLACLARARLYRGIFVTTFLHLLVEGLNYLPSGLYLLRTVKVSQLGKLIFSQGFLGFL